MEIDSDMDTGMDMNNGKGNVEGVNETQASLAHANAGSQVAGRLAEARAFSRELDSSIESARQAAGRIADAAIVLEGAWMTGEMDDARESSEVFELFALLGERLEQLARGMELAKALAEYCALGEYRP